MTINSKKKEKDLLEKFQKYALNLLMWETLPNNADWDCCKTPILQETMKTQNLHQVEHCAFFGSHMFVPISWMCKKQTSVLHSSTEAEIISLDAGLRMDGVPALDFSNLVKEVIHSAHREAAAVCRARLAGCDVCSLSSSCILSSILGTTCLPWLERVFKARPPIHPCNSSTQFGMKSSLLQARLEVGPPM